MKRKEKKLVKMLTIRISEDLSVRLKIAAAKRRVTTQDLVTEAILNQLKRGGQEGNE